MNPSLSSELPRRDLLGFRAGKTKYVPMCNTIGPQMIGKIKEIKEQVKEAVEEIKKPEPTTYLDLLERAVDQNWTEEQFEQECKNRNINPEL